MKFEIKITKEVLETTKNCGNYISELVGQNCAVAYAICRLFPHSWTGSQEILLFKEGDKIVDMEQIINTHLAIATIKLPAIAKSFIDAFDKSSPEKRVAMEPFSFEIDVPESIIEGIDISEILKDCQTMKLVSQR